MDTKQIQQTIFSKFAEIFKDSNHFNEKTIIGFMSFAVMTIYSLVDIVTGVYGIKLEIHEFVYNSFMYITLGSFGIAGLEKFSPSTIKKVEAAQEN
jgi:hypothetical protein